MPVVKFTKASFNRPLKRTILATHLAGYEGWEGPWDFRIEPKETDDAWHPSGDCLASPTELYLGKTQEGGSGISPALRRTFLVGHFWHQAIQHAIVDLGYAAPEHIERTGLKVWSLDPDQEPTPYHWVRGTGDVVPLTMPRWSGILDIKTMSKDDFVTAEKSGLLPLRFADKYEAQMNIYMDLFDQERSVILGVCKDSPHGFIEFAFERNQSLVDSIYQKWEYIGRCILEGHAPDTDISFPLTFTGPIG